MSNFANLRKARRAKEQQKSYIKSEHEQGIQKDTKSPSEVAELLEGFYTTWPTSRFEIRISVEDSLRGRGVFSREQYRPGKFSI
jgi:hypothetical protein